MIGGSHILLPSSLPPTERGGREREKEREKEREGVSWERGGEEEERESEREITRVASTPLILTLGRQNQAAGPSTYRLTD